MMAIFDVDGDGVVGYDEFQKGMHKLMHPFSRDGGIPLAHDMPSTLAAAVVAALLANVGLLPKTPPQPPDSNNNNSNNNCNSSNNNGNSNNNSNNNNISNNNTTTAPNYAAAPYQKSISKSKSKSKSKIKSKSKSFHGQKDGSTGGDSDGERGVLQSMQSIASGLGTVLGASSRGSTSTVGKKKREQRRQTEHYTPSSFATIGQNGGHKHGHEGST